MINVTKSLILISLFLVSCGKRSTNLQLSSQINTDSLLDYHISVLSNSNALLTKSLKINNSVQTADVDDSKINWANELESFRTISLINKPIYLTSYNITFENDKKSNLLVRKWEVKQDLPLKKLKIYYLKDLSQIKRLEATIEQRNFVFSSTKQLSIDFGVLGADRMVDDYEVSGHQKLIWGEPQDFSIKGHVRIK